MSEGKGIVLLWLLMPLIGAASFSKYDRVILEGDHDVGYWNTEGWKVMARVAPHEKVHLTFAIKQENLAELEEIFWSVSNPKSKNYGRYLDAHSVGRIVKPSKESIHAVKSWLLDNHLDSCFATRNNDFIICETTSVIAEDLLLGAKFYRFQHLENLRFVIRSFTHYSVPNKIAKHLDFVGGLLRFPASNYAMPKVEEAAVLDGGNIDLHIGVYPSVLRARYNVSSTVGKHPNNSQAVAQFLGQFYNSHDLTEFFSLFGRGFTHLADISKVVGPDTGRSGIEASLDVQYIMSLGANITTWFWSTPDKHESQEPFLEWIIAVGNTSQVPFVISVSYGDNEDSLSVNYMNRINIEFMKAGVRGITILFASGDNGAGCKKDIQFRPNFPCSSPYVTAVGGTAFNNPFEVGAEYGYEISGGGFSNVFKRPEYQDSAVNYYLTNSKKLPNASLFNQTGRGYPDISALCNHFWIVNNYIPVPGVMGTSASTPTVAGIISLLNDVRFQNNKPSMGFLNPFLYSHAHSLFDPTTGYNEGCGEPDRGFYAMEGWDPVTGCGTPNYPSLVEAALKVAH